MVITAGSVITVAGSVITVAGSVIAVAGSMTTVTGGCRSSGEAPADAWGTAHLKYAVEYSDGTEQVEYSGAHEGESCDFSCDAVCSWVQYSVRGCGIVSCYPS